MSLKTKFIGLTLDNPTILQSGTLGLTGASLGFVAKHGVGALTSTSLTLNERRSFPSPMITASREGLLMARGHPNPGAEHFLKEIRLAKRFTSKPVIASIVEDSIEKFGELAKIVSKAPPDAIEMNLASFELDVSLPRPMSFDVDLAYEAVREVRRSTKLPLIVRITSQAEDFWEIAQAVERAGANALSCVDGIGPALAIDPITKKPLLGTGMGMLHGPSLKPIVQRCIFELYTKVRIPLIAAGGVMSGKDAAEMIMAGASAVAIGSGIYYHGLDIFRSISEDLQKIMIKHNYKSIREMRGVAHGR